MLIFLSLLLSQFYPLWAQTRILEAYDPHTDIIAENYEAGAYLIYDCQEKHFTCVLENYFKECRLKREEDLVEQKTWARCAPLGKLPTKKSCFQRQLFMVSHNYGTRFCILPGWKEKEMLQR